MIHKGKCPRGMTAAQLSILVVMALVAAAVLGVNASSDYIGESPGQTVAEAFLVDPDALGYSKMQVSADLTRQL